MAEVAFGVVRRAQDLLIPEMDRELLEVPHHLLDLGPNRWRRLLDFIEYRFKLLESRCIRRTSEYALELAPDNRGVKVLRVRVPNALEYILSELLLAVFQEMVVTPVVERAEIVFHDLGIIRAAIRDHDEGEFIFESDSEKFTSDGRTPK